jgi:hypothetical protein
MSNARILCQYVIDERLPLVLHCPRQLRISPAAQRVPNKNDKTFNSNQTLFLNTQQSLMKKIKKIVDVTPAEYICPYADCPAVLKTDVATYLVIGKILDHSHPAVVGRIGRDETVVEIPAEILEGAIASQLRNR